MCNTKDRNSDDSHKELFQFPKFLINLKFFVFELSLKKGKIKWFEFVLEVLLFLIQFISKSLSAYKHFKWLQMAANGISNQKKIDYRNVFQFTHCIRISFLFCLVDIQTGKVYCVLEKREN